jgi:hypothetical protein
MRSRQTEIFRLQHKELLFNYGMGCLSVMLSMFFLIKLPNLKFETWTKQLLDNLHILFCMFN